jgi:serine/threonine protein kinase
MREPEVPTRPLVPTTPEVPAAGTARPGLPQHIDRYRVEKVLGRGGFGIVYLAHDDQLHRPVAIKVPHRERISSPEDAEAYLAEARILAGLDQPHIVPVHDVGSTEDRLPFVVSKFIEGSDLKERIKAARPSFKDSAALVATIAEALHYAHRKGLVHRDIKPANILNDNAGKPYVADFGLALKQEDFGRGPGFAGTPAYMSPEQARGEGTVSMAAPTSSAWAWSSTNCSPGGDRSGGKHGRSFWSRSPGSRPARLGRWTTPSPRNSNGFA